MPTAYPGRPAYSTPAYQSSYPQGPVAWTPPPIDMSWDNISVINAAQDEAYKETGNPGSSFNSGAMGLSSYLSNVWQRILELEKQGGYIGKPKYTRVSDKVAIIEDESFNPEEYGGYMEDYFFMKNMEAGRVFKKDSVDRKFLNPGGIGWDPIHPNLRRHLKTREREINKQRDESDKKIIENLEKNAEEKDKSVFDSLKGSASGFWDAVGNAFHSTEKSNYDIQLIALVGIGGLLLFMLVRR